MPTLIEGAELRVLSHGLAFGELIKGTGALGVRRKNPCLRTLAIERDDVLRDLLRIPRGAKDLVLIP